MFVYSCMYSKKTLLALIIFCMSSAMAFGQAEVLFGVTPDPIKSVQIYPNPAVEFVNIKFSTPIASKVKLALYNVIGNNMEAEQEILDEYEIRIKIKDLNSGYYLVSIKDARINSAGTFKFLKR